MQNPRSRTANRLASHDIVLLVTCLVILAATWAFVALLDEVQEGDTRHFDEWTVRAIAKFHGIVWLDEVGRDITAPGSVSVLAIVTLIVVGYLLLVRKFAAMWLVLIAVVGGQALTSLLKYFIDRPRPDLVRHLSTVYTSSFPSGHSMMAAVVYLTLGSLLARLVARPVVKLYCIGVALAVTCLVGVSRVYMGVHWPTDVLAGWTAGLAWAILCWLVAQQLQRRHIVELDVGDQHEIADEQAACNRDERKR